VNPGSRLQWLVLTWWTIPQSDNLVSPSHDNSGLFWTVSEPVKGTAGPVERLGALQMLICAPVVRPKRCPTLLTPALLPSWTVVCLSFTLLLMLLLPGWPTMGLNRICKKKLIVCGYLWTDPFCGNVIGYRLERPTRAMKYLICPSRRDLCSRTIWSRSVWPCFLNQWPVLADYSDYY